MGPDPRDALEVLQNGDDAEYLTEEEVSVMAEIPESYARLAMSPIWGRIMAEHSK